MQNETNQTSRGQGGKLSGLTVAFLCTDGVEQVELTEPKRALEAEGATTTLISLKKGKFEAWNHFDAGDQFEAQLAVSDADPDNFDALVLPGGVANPDQLRSNREAVDFVRSFVQSGKPIASICHGPWTLIEADGVRGKKITSWPSLKTDLRNAGAIWGDESVIRDGNLVTSRKPADLEDFNRETIEMIAEHQSTTRVGDQQRMKAQDSAAPSAQI